MFLAVFVGLVAVLALSFYFWAKTRRDFWKYRNVPFIESPLLAGNFIDALLMRRSMTDLLVDLYNHDVAKDEPFVGINLFHRPGILVRDPDLIRRIYLKDFNYFSNRFLSTHPKADGIGYNNLFLVRNPLWKKLRNKLTPIFSTGKIKNMFPLVKKVGESLNSVLIQKAKEAEGGNFVMDTKSVVALFGIDVIGTVAFGIEPNCLKNANSEFEHFVMQMFSFSLFRALEFTSIFLLPDIAKFLNFKFFKGNVSAFMRRTFLDVMTERERTGVVRNDLIDVLIGLRRAAKESGEESLFEGDVLVAQAAVFLAAGHETSSSISSYFLYEIAKKPEIQQRLREEIRSTLAKCNGEINYDLLTNEMPYLGQVLNETVRFYPILPHQERLCEPPKGEAGYSLKPISNVVIPRGTPIIIPVQAIHMDSKYFPNPEVFDPDRFAPGNDIPSYAYLPFGSGLHSCIGERFALMQVKLALMYMLKSFRVEMIESTPKTINFHPAAILMHATEALNLKFIHDELF